MTGNTNDETLVLKTTRLQLVPATVGVVRAAAAMNHAKMAKLLNADVPPDWPPDLLQDALTPTADALEAGHSIPPWTMYWILLDEPRTLIGTCGFKDEPSGQGQVDLGYAIVNSHQRRGYASEATRALIDFAFADDRVTHVVAETLPELVPSIRVMEKVGMARVDSATTGFSGEENVVRYEIRRQ